MNDTILQARTSPPVAGRHTAQVAAAMFDAVNGIVGHYEPVHVTRRIDGNASPEVAAVQAAYATLISIYRSPSQVAALSARRDASLAALAAVDHGGSMQAGIEWGQQVADEIG